MDPIESKTATTANTPSLNKDVSQREQDIADKEKQAAQLHQDVKNSGSFEKVVDILTGTDQGEGYAQQTLNADRDKLKKIP